MEAILILITAIITTSLTYYISIKLSKGPVLGSAFVVLVSGVLFYKIIPQYNFLAFVATGASYAGMVTTEYIKGIFPMVLVGIIFGVLYILIGPAFSGIGGRLGALAAISCFIFIGLYKLTFLRPKVNER